MSFTQLSLHDALVAVEKAAEQAGVSVRIGVDGKALQFEGITRNQIIREFAQRQQPLRRILTAIVVAANPSRNGGPTSRQQKLVWTLDRESQSILITTRQAAESQGRQLPTELQLSE